MFKVNWKACGKFPGKIETFNLTETENVHWKLEGMWKVSR